METEPTTYKEERGLIEAEQKDLSYDEVKEAMEKKSEHIVELDQMASQIHNWVDRGAVMSCEGATHANHHVYKRLR